MGTPVLQVQSLVPVLLFVMCQCCPWQDLGLVVVCREAKCRVPMMLWNCVNSCGPLAFLNKHPQLLDACSCISQAAGSHLHGHGVHGP
jgi:hypothetical protein